MGPLDALKSVPWEVSPSNLPIWCIRIFSQFQNDTSFIKTDQGIQILQLKIDRKFLLFFAFFSECFHLNLRKSTSTKFPPPFLMCCITYACSMFYVHPYAHSMLIPAHVYVSAQYTPVTCLFCFKVGCSQF